MNGAVISQRERRRSKGIRDICKSHEPRREITFDLVIEILTRLPAKSLMRFKSVSKLWSSLICSQYFTNRFLKVSSSTSRIYMWLGFDNKNVLLSSSASPDSDVTTMSSFVVDQDLTIPAMEGYYISHFFRGLMCFTNGSKAQIYNTTTRQLVVLPDIEESNIVGQKMYRIGHDPVHDQYKVFFTVSRRGDRVENLETYMSEHWVLLIGRAVSSRWRKIPSRCPPHRPLPKLGLTINGRMQYYLAWVRSAHLVLVSFDISSEEISMLQVPENHAFGHYYFTDLIECRGRVALLGHVGLKDKGVMKLWVMEDAEKNRWSSEALVLHLSQMVIVNMHMVDNTSFRVQGTTSKGEVIFVPQNIYIPPLRGAIKIKPQNTTLFYVFLYNLEKNHMRKVEIIESSNSYRTQYWDVIGFDDIENLMYL